MKVTYTNKPPKTTFADIKVGTLFSTSVQGLFIKTDVTWAVIIHPSVDKHAAEAGVGSSWDPNEVIFPIKSLKVNL